MNFERGRIVKAPIIFLIGIVLLLLPYLLISVYCNPSLDDYSYAYNGQHYSLFFNCTRDYLNWNGRYFSNILVFLNPMAFDAILVYKAIPVILIVFTFISLFYLLRTITDLLTKA